MNNFFALFILYESFFKIDDEEASKMNEKLNVNLELLGSLKVAESAFNDWYNEEDSVYYQI